MVVKVFEACLVDVRMGVARRVVAVLVVVLDVVVLMVRVRVNVGRRVVVVLVGVGNFVGVVVGHDRSLVGGDGTVPVGVTAESSNAPFDHGCATLSGLVGPDREGQRRSSALGRPATDGRDAPAPGRPLGGSGRRATTPGRAPDVRSAEPTSRFDRPTRRISGARRVLTAGPGHGVLLRRFGVDRCPQAGS